MAIKIKNELLKNKRIELNYTRAYVEEMTQIKQDRILALEEGQIGNTKQTVGYAEVLCDLYNLNREEIINYDYRNTQLICFGMSKGGTGKSTTVAEIAFQLSKKHKVLIIDGDPQCNVTRLYAKETLNFDDSSTNNLANFLRLPEENISGYNVNDLINPTRIKNVDIIVSHPDLYMAASFLKAKMFELGPYKVLREYLINKGNYDFVLIDTPPNIDVATIGLYIIADKFYMPINMEPFTRDSIPTFLKAVNLAKSSKAAIFPGTEFQISGVIKTKFDGRKLVDKEISQFVDESFGNLVLNIEVPLYEGIKQSQYGNLLLNEFDSKSERSKLVSKAYRAIAMEVIK